MFLYSVYQLFHLIIIRINEGVSRLECQIAVLLPSSYVHVDIPVEYVSCNYSLRPYI